MADVFCRNCGKQISELADVCIGCGVATGRIPRPAAAPYVVSVPQPKSDVLAIVLTIIFPGAGHLYIGMNDKALPHLIANAIGFLLAWTLILFPISFIIWLVTLIITVPGISSEVAQVNRANGF